jgi:glutamate formiminotransferase
VCSHPFKAKGIVFLGIKRLKIKQFNPTQKSNGRKIGENFGVVIYLHQSSSLWMLELD